MVLEGEGHGEGQGTGGAEGELSGIGPVQQARDHGSWS